MSEELRKFFERESDIFLKYYEIQFNHFMRVFYFWIAVITLPATAGLIAGNGKLFQENIALLLYLLAIVGILLSLKMYDIRCSQLRYIILISSLATGNAASLIRR